MANPAAPWEADEVVSGRAAAAAPWEGDEIVDTPAVEPDFEDPRDIQARGIPTKTPPSSAIQERNTRQPSLTEQGQLAGQLADPFGSVKGDLGLEQARGTQLGKGVEAGVYGAGQIVEGARMWGATNAARQARQTLAQIQAVDEGKSPFELGGDTSLAQRYAMADAPSRARLRDETIKNLASQKDVQAQAVKNWREYQGRMQAVTGRVPNLTDVEDAKGFGDWLAYNAGQGAVYIVPMMLTALATGPAGVAGAGYVMGLGDLTQQRMEKAIEVAPDLAMGGQQMERQTASSRPGQDVERASEEVERSGGISAALAVPYAALDTVLGPVAKVALPGVSRAIGIQIAKRATEGGIGAGVRAVGKEAAKEMGEEFLNEGGQQFLGSLQDTILDDAALFTPENMKSWFNAGAAGAAGAFAPGAFHATAAGIRAAEKKPGGGKPKPGEPGAKPEEEKPTANAASEWKQAEAVMEPERVDGETVYRTPNGARITPEQWDNASERVRSAWLTPVTPSPEVSREAVQPVPGAETAGAEAMPGVPPAGAEGIPGAPPPGAGAPAAPRKVVGGIRVDEDLVAAPAPAEEAPPTLEAAAAPEEVEHIEAAPAPKEAVSSPLLDELERLQANETDPAVGKVLGEQVRAERNRLVAQQQSAEFMRASEQAAHPEVKESLRKRALKLAGIKEEREAEKPAGKGIKVTEEETLEGRPPSEEELKQRDTWMKTHGLTAASAEEAAKVRHAVELNRPLVTQAAKQYGDEQHAEFMKVVQGVIDAETKPGAAAAHKPGGGIEQGVRGGRGHAAERVPKVEGRPAAQEPAKPAEAAAGGKAAVRGEPGGGAAKAGEHAAGRPKVRVTRTDRSGKTRVVGEEKKPAEGAAERHAQIAKDLKDSEKFGERDAPLLRTVAAMNLEASRQEFVKAAVEAGYNKDSAEKRFRESRKFDKENYGHEFDADGRLVKEGPEDFEGPHEGPAHAVYEPAEMETRRKSAVRKLAEQTREKVRGVVQRSLDLIAKQKYRYEKGDTVIGKDGESYKIIAKDVIPDPTQTDRPRAERDMVPAYRVELRREPGRKLDLAEQQISRVQHDVGEFEKAEPATRATQSADRQLATISKDIQAQFPSKKVGFEIVSPNDPSVPSQRREMAGVAKAIVEAHGGKVVFIKHTGDKVTRGFVDPRFPDTIYVALDTDSTTLAVAGHEFGHWLEKNHPDLWDEFVKQILPVLKNIGEHGKSLQAKYERAQRADPASQRVLFRELISDIWGDMFTDPQFHSELAAAHPGFYKRMADALIKFINDVVAKVKAVRPLGSEKFITDMERARKITADTLAKLKTRVTEQRELEAGIARMLGAQAEHAAYAPTFYSELAAGVDSIPAKQMSGPDWIQRIGALKGVKKDEIEWSGLPEWLATQTGKIPKEAVQNYLRQNGVRVEETMLGAAQPPEGFKAYETLRGRERGFTLERVGGQAGTWGRTVSEAAVALAQKYEEQAARLQASKSKGDKAEAEELWRRAAALTEYSERAEGFGAGVTKFGEYVLPGGKEYRELLLRLPEARPSVYTLREKDNGWIAVVDPRGVEVRHLPNMEAARAWMNTEGARRRAIETGGGFKSQHFDQPNILAHVRFNERTDADGKKVLFIEEIQSDWAQKGKREGFATGKEAKNFSEFAEREGLSEPQWRRIWKEQNDLHGADRDLWNRWQAEAKRYVGGIPAAPFVGKTEAWTGLALKRMIRYAAENGFDRVAWTTGEQQADRYDLSQRIGAIQANWVNDERVNLRIKEHGENRYNDNLEVTVTKEQLPDHVGKELAEKIIAQKSAAQTYSGLDLKIGGEGMKAFYDKIVLNIANDVLKKLGGGKVGEVRIEVDPLGESIKDDEVRLQHGMSEEAWDNATRQERNAMRNEYIANLPAQPAFDITPQMAGKALEGMPMFKELESDVGHRREMATGRYVGAPDWVGNSPQKLTALRAKLRQLAKEGEPGRFWYENSSRAILNMVGGDRAEAQKLAALIAIYSPNATVPANTAMALNAYYQFKAGKEIKAGFGAANRKALELLRDGKMWEGIKTNSFYQNLMVNIDPSKLEPGRATMDMWMALAADYGMKALDQGPKYNFLNRETERLGRELGWTAHQTQAAIWTAIKGRIDPIRPALRERELKLGIGHMVKDKDGKLVYEVKPERRYDHFRLAHKMGMARDLESEDVATSKYDFSDALRERSVQMSWEATPGKSTPDIPGIHNATVQQKFEYLTAVTKAIYPGGKDLIAEAVGLPQGYSHFGFSAWQGDIGAGAQTLFPVSMAGAGAKREVNPEARKLLDQYAALKGYVLHQEAVVWHAPMFDSSERSKNGVAITTQRPWTENEVEHLYRALYDKFGTWNIAPGYTESGVRILNFDVDNKTFQNGVREILEALPEEFGGGAGEDGHLAFFRSDGNYVGNDWTASPNGEDYRAHFESGRPDLSKRADDIRARVEAVNKDFAKRYGWDEAAVGEGIQHSVFEEPAAADQQLESPAFKSWFGDSKIVDQDGKPKVVYHVPAKSDELALAAGGRFRAGHLGAMFTEKPQGKAPIAAYLKITNPLDASNEKVREQYRADRQPGESLDEYAMRTGHDGLITSLGDEYVVFDPEGIRAAAGQGETAVQHSIFEGASPDDQIQHAVYSPSPLAQMAGERKFERLWFDKLNRTLQAEEAVREVGAQVADPESIRLAEKLFHGRAQHEGEQFEAKYVEPLGKELKAAKKVGLTVRDADDYLMALHAPERNATMKQRDPQGRDGLSGMTDAQAAQIIASFTPEQITQLNKVRAIVRDMTRANLDRLVNAGLITPATRAALNAQWQNYVPLKTLEQEGQLLGTGRGYEMWGTDIKTALGRMSKAGSPIAASIMDSTRAIIRSEKARVEQAMWAFAQKPEAAEIMREYDPANPPASVMTRKLDPNTGQWKEVVDSAKVQDQTLHIMINGEEKRLYVPDELLRQQLRKAGEFENLAPMLEGMAKLTRTVGRTLTEWNPSFTFPNAVKDAISAVIRARGIKGMSAARVVLGIPKAWASIVQAKRGKLGGIGASYEAFKELGGKTGAYGITGWQEALTKLAHVGAELGYPDQKPGVVKSTLHRLHGILDALSAANEILEYATRLSAFEEAKRAGYSPQRSAEIGKEITVNFNRAGELSKGANALFVFFNAALQGLYSTVQFAKDNARIVQPDSTVGKKTRRAMYALAAIGFALQALNEWGGGDDDDTGEKNVNTLSDYTLDKNATVLMPGTSKGIKIPLPPEYAFAYALGRRLYRAGSQRDFGKEAAGIVANLLDATLPVRLPDSTSAPISAVKALEPTVLLPWLEVAANENFMGMPIVPDQKTPTAPQPYFTISRRDTSDMAKGVSELLNTATGGTRIEPGLSQKFLGKFASPEAIQHITGSYTGGLGQTVMQAKNIGKAAAGDEEAIDINKVPIVGRFAFTQPKGYANKRYRELASEFQYEKRRLNAGEPPKDEAVMAAMGAFDAAESELRKTYPALRSAEEHGNKELAKALQDQIVAAQKRVIQVYTEAKRAQ